MNTQNSIFSMQFIVNTIIIAILMVILFCYITPYAQSAEPPIEPTPSGTPTPGGTPTPTPTPNPKLTGASCKKCCVQNQTTLSKDDFYLTYNPQPSSEPSLNFSPATVSTFLQEQNVNVSVTASGSAQGSVNTFVSVINEDIVTNRTLDPSNFTIFKTLKDVVKEIDSLGKGIKACEVNFGDISGLTISTSSGKKCCSEQNMCSIKDAITASADGSADIFNFACDFPFWGIPYIASVNVTTNGSIGSRVSINGQSTCEKPKFCGSVSPIVEIGGGLSGIVGTKKGIYASGTIQASFSGDATLCYNAGKGMCLTSNGSCINITAVGQIQTFELITKSFQAPIAKKCFYGAPEGSGCN